MSRERRAGSRDILEVLRSARDLLTIERAFGAPIKRDGVTIIPVAKPQRGHASGPGTATTPSGGSFPPGPEPPLAALKRPERSPSHHRISQVRSSLAP
jgi:hypothetical protein